MARLKVENLSKTFHLKKEMGESVGAVKNVSFEIDGETLSLLGPSGSGKTTTLNCIAGLETPDSGTITIGDRVVTSKDVFVQPEKRNLGMVFQSYAVWPHMNVRDNIAFPLKLRKYDKARIEKRVAEVIALTRLTGLEKRSISQLSGGQQQRVSLARALAHSPDVLLLDEPLSNLDAKLREEMRGELRDLLKSLKMTAVFVTHDQLEALTISDEVAVMNKGELVQRATPREIYESPRHPFVASFIGTANFVKGTISFEGRGVVTGFGLVKCAIPADALDGSQVTLCIRPENIRVGGPISSENSFECKLEKAMFQGEFYDCRVRIGTELLKARPSSIGDLLEGATTTAQIDSQKARVMNLDATQAPA